LRRFTCLPWLAITAFIQQLNMPSVFNRPRQAFIKTSPAAFSCSVG
jgi:hypothetical protein